MRSPLERIDTWFRRPQQNAAGNAGLFRIVFAIGYLWHVSLFDMSAIVGAPTTTRAPLFFVSLLPPGATVGDLHGLEMLLVAALVVLLFGLWVPFTTVVVLIAGVLREGYLSQFDIENGNLIPVFLIPLLATVSASWGATYSLDAWLSRDRGATSVAAAHDGWSFALLPRAALVLLAALFPMSAVLKMTGGGTWLRESELLPRLLLERSVDASVLGLSANPLAPWFAEHAVWGKAMQIGVLLFELSFVFLLVGGGVRRMLLALAMAFHTLSAWWLLVSFNGVLAAYASFVDWQSAWQRVRVLPPLALLSGRAHALGPRAWRYIACALAVLAALLWHRGARQILSLGGVIDWQTPWLVIGPLAMLVLFWRQWRGAPSQL